MHGFYRLKQEKDVSICWRRVTNRYKKYDSGCPMTPLATKNRRSVCTRLTETKVFDKLSRGFCKTHIKQLEKCWSNIFGPSNKILFIWYPEQPFSLQNILCLVQNKCLLFIFRNMYCIGFIGKYWFKSKTSTKFPNFQKSILGLKSEYI